MGATSVSGRLPPEVIQRIVRQQYRRFRSCYQAGLRRNPALRGTVFTRFIIGRDGRVSNQPAASGSLADLGVRVCVARIFYGLSFPAPNGGIVTVSYPLSFAPNGSSMATAAASPSKPALADPHAGRFKTVMAALEDNDPAGALELASKWRQQKPADVMALVALGEAYEANRDFEKAARSYGSIIDMFPARADMRRFAGNRLERIRVHGALQLAVDTYRKAVQQRPDHPSSHRLLAFALAAKGKYEQAFDALATALKRRYPGGRFAGVLEVLRDDLGLLAAGWIRSAPSKRDAIVKRLTELGGKVANQASLRFVLTWETDANDVDLHVYDAAGGHAYFEHRQLASGGALHADVTTGYGPECFTIDLPSHKRSRRYTLQAHYYSRGPMGYGMGKLQIIEHDGTGGLKFSERPFVVMRDGAYANLGTVVR